MIQKKKDPADNLIFYHKDLYKGKFVFYVGTAKALNKKAKFR